MPGALFGKLALVTGAGSGIGRAACKAFVRAGVRVIAADKNLDSAQETISDLGSESSAVEMDVSNYVSVNKAVESSIQKYRQPPSIVVNSAGIIGDAYLLKMSEEQFDKVCGVNLKGTFLVTQRFANAMVQYKVSGSIVNISSVSAKLNNIGQCNYAAAKAGVISLTKVAAKEFGKFNIRVNAVLPGYIDTQMVEKLPEKLKAQLLERCPMGRMGRPEEVADAILFLASNHASFVNGATLEVTGGIS